MYEQYKFIKTGTAGNRTGFIIGKDSIEIESCVELLSEGNLYLNN